MSRKFIMDANIGAFKIKVFSSSELESFEEAKADAQNNMYGSLLTSLIGVVSQIPPEVLARVKNVQGKIPTALEITEEEFQSIQKQAEEQKEKNKTVAQKQAEALSKVNVKEEVVEKPVENVVEVPDETAEILEETKQS